jgi:hypothetical protein
MPEEKMEKHAVTLARLWTVRSIADCLVGPIFLCHKRHSIRSQHSSGATDITETHTAPFIRSPVVRSLPPNPRFPWIPLPDPSNKGFAEMAHDPNWA